MRITSIVVLLLAAASVLGQEKDTWNRWNDEVTLRCADPNVSQEPLLFQGMFDECDNTDKAPYEPDDSDAVLNLVIDPRNADDLLWDTARYKRYGTYEPPVSMDWHHPNGFDQIWTRVFYANGDENVYGHMRYQVSNDGVNFVEADDISRTEGICTADGGSSCWYRMKTETVTLRDTYTYIRAIWPPPCQGEVDFPNVKSCTTFGPEEDKDIYYAPQLGDIVLSSDEDLRVRPGIPQNLQLEVQRDGTVLATWEAPEEGEVGGYVIYFHADYPQEAADDFYAPPYLARSMNVGLATTVVLDTSHVPSNRNFIVRVAAVGLNGRRGVSSLNQAVELRRGNNLLDECPRVPSPPPSEDDSSPATTGDQNTVDVSSAASLSFAATLSMTLAMII